MCDKKQTIVSPDVATERHISDNEKFVLKGIIELIPDWETNETLKKIFLKFLKLRKRQKNGVLILKTCFDVANIIVSY